MDTAFLDDKVCFYNAKNTSTSHTFFKLNCGYCLYVTYKKNLNLCLKSKIIKKLSFKFRKLIAVCQQNLYYTQKFQNRPIIKMLSINAMLYITSLAE